MSFFLLKLRDKLLIESLNLVIFIFKIENYLLKKNIYLE